MAGQHLATYDPESRFRNWKRAFDDKFNKLESDINSITILAKDPNDIYLIDVTNQLIEYEHQLQKYDSSHKTDVFHDFQDIKSKLLKQLDIHIDISDSPERRDNRLKLYDRLSELATHFENKIHEGHFTCPVCVQVKVVMINLMSNQTHHKEYDFLVKVSENSLQINKNVLKQLNALVRYNNHKVIVLSVIGQPKSRKTSLMNYVLRLLSREDLPPDHLLPLTGDDENLKYEEGVLIYNPIRRKRSELLYIWLLLDIWMPNPRKAIYKKLVDFCLNMSSTVIFSEPCEQGSPPIYWNPELSLLPQLSISIENSLQLHFLIRTDGEGKTQCYSEGSPLDHHCNHLLLPKLGTVIKTHSFLKTRCFHITSTYIPAAAGEDYQFETFREILLNAMFKSLKINDGAIKITEVGGWFEWCVDAINKLFALSASDNQNALTKVETTSIYQQKVVPLFDRVDSNDTNVPPTCTCQQKVVPSFDRVDSNDANGPPTSTDQQTDVPPLDRFDSNDANGPPTSVDQQNVVPSFDRVDSNDANDPPTSTDHLTDVPSLDRVDSNDANAPPTSKDQQKVVPSFDRVDSNDANGPPTSTDQQTDVPPLDRVDSNDANGPPTTTDQQKVVPSFDRVDSNDANGPPTSTDQQTDVPSFDRVDSNDGNVPPSSTDQQKVVPSFDRVDSNDGNVPPSSTDQQTDVPSFDRVDSNDGNVPPSSTDQQKVVPSFDRVDSNDGNVPLKNQPYQIDVLLLKACDEYLIIFESLLKDREWITSDEDGITSLQKYILEEILTRLFPVTHLLKATVEKHIKEWSITMIVMIQIYKTKFSEQLNEKLFIEDEEFLKLHEMNLMTAKTAVQWEEFPREKLNKLFEDIADDQIKALRSSNSLISEEEVQISAEAYHYAVNNFKTLMDGKLSSTTLTEQELKMIHQRMTTFTLDIFLDGLELPHTTPWKLEKQHLQETLKSLEAVYIQNNKSHLKKVETARKAAIEVGKQCYRDEMIKILPETRLCCEEFEHFSNFSFEIAIRRFNEYIGNNFNKTISMTWESGVKNAIDEIKSNFFQENKRKKPVRLNIPDPTAQKQSTTAQPLKFDRFGISLYIDPHKVHAGIYVDQQMEFGNKVFDHTIAIRYGEIFFGQEAASQANDNRDGTIWFSTVFELLCNHNGFSWLVNVSGSLEKLRQEEILALYFHHIRMEIQRNVNDKVSSCFVVCTGLLNSGAKQILKTSLSLAGFDNNTLISCTTAMAISYSLQSQHKMHSNLFVYTCSNLIEVAVVHIADTHLDVKNVCGDIVGKVDDTKLESRLKSIFLDAPSPRDYNKIVLCNESNPVDKNVLCDMAHNLAKNIFRCNTLFFDTLTDIVKVAAMLDAVRKGNSKVPPLPRYNVVHPYEIRIDIKGRRLQTFSDFNNNSDKQLWLKRSGDVQKVVFLERAKASKERWNVGTYHLWFRHHNYKTKASILLRKEGNFFVELCAQEDFIMSNINSITSIGRQEIFTATKPLIEELDCRFEREFHLVEPTSSSGTTSRSSSSQSSASSHKMDNGNETSLEDLRNNLAIPKEKAESDSGISNSTSTVYKIKNGNETSLDVLKKSITILIIKTESELRISKSTSTAVRENIVSKIGKCRAMMESSDVKIKQLEIDKMHLERAAKLIKL